MAGGATRFGFGWFVPAILKHRKLCGEVLLASFFIQVFALVTPLFFQVVIDKALVHRALSTLEVLAAGLLVVSLFDVLLNGLRAHVFTHTSNRVDVLLGARLFRHLLALPLAYGEARRVGDSVVRIRELENIRNFLTGSSSTLVVDLLFTFVFLAVLYCYSPLLAAVVAAAVPFYQALSAVITPIFRHRLDDKFNRGAEKRAFLVESVTGIETVKSMALEPEMQRRGQEQLAGYVSASFRVANLGNIAGQSAGFANKVTVVLILWVGSGVVIGGELTVGQLVTFNMLAGRVGGPIRRLVQLWQDFQQAGLSVRRLGDILNTAPEPGNRAGRTTLPALRGAVSCDQVTFRYAPDRPEALRDIRLDVKSGEVIGIVGRSGSGKSTFAKLIQRLLVPECGRLLVDGVDLALVEAAWLRRQIGVVLQENFLSNRSVRDNIAPANPGVPMERVVKAAQMGGHTSSSSKSEQDDNDLVGGAQEEVLVGKGGSDLMIGIAGGDVYLYNAGDSAGCSDFIDDFPIGGDTPGEDTLSLGGGIRPEDVTAALLYADYGGEYELILQLDVGDGGAGVEFFSEFGGVDGNDLWTETCHIEQLQFVAEDGCEVFDLQALVDTRYDALVSAGAAGNTVRLITPELLAAALVAANGNVAGGNPAYNYATTGDPFSPPETQAPRTLGGAGEPGVFNRRWISTADSPPGSSAGTADVPALIGHQLLSDDLNSLISAMAAFSAAPAGAYLK